ncbi:S-methyl-5'-thioadenosine phosphorylase [bacterium]|nr:MAG: S-methyl-5'-thioadenosine phosphorylase [bacterium]
MIWLVRVDAAVIGGSGVGSRLRELGGRAFCLPTAFGLCRGRLLEHEGLNLLLLERHGAGHRNPPHAVPYAAMATALKRLGAPPCFSTAAVGSLRPEWGPGTFVVCSDFLDLTSRNLTLFSNRVEHRDFTEPFSPKLREALMAAIPEAQPAGVYLGLNGPRYETPQEIRTFRGLGADVVGMTASSEATAMREAGVPYSCLAIVTNLASGIAAGPLDHHGDVMPQMERSGARAVEGLLAAVRSVTQ